jgi:hypothetical protein
VKQGIFECAFSAKFNNAQKVLAIGRLDVAVELLAFKRCDSHAYLVGIPPEDRSSAIRMEPTELDISGNPAVGRQASRMIPRDILRPIEETNRERLNRREHLQIDVRVTFDRVHLLKVIGIRQ